ncbi:BT_3928 family protein [Albibacterium bauzanense]|uniref:DoxX-like protein n=1 Tax=Albibacterium bauzanense TaxID=653929 RepID=A0A4R1LVY2_9SPHI|nr:BT_3928 family protein [Albibacterium bauzanense]TCK83255.1 DoxX-like protein [Albibacterium bauzanense]
MIWIVRLIVSILFIFSGLIKANDPIGFSYKLVEYFGVFKLNFLNDYSVAIAIAICSLEIILGALLLFGFWSKKTIWGILLLIIFFTFLTFYSAFFEVVTSCGCFGDAIPLTPWESFAKDCVLLALIGILFYYKEHIKPLIKDFYTQSILTTCIVVISIGFGVYTYNFLPIIDFLPYKVGNNLPSLMTIPEGESLDEYETIYVLKNKETNETKKVGDKEYLQDEIWKDQSWEIVGDPETRLIKKGYQIPISDLIISDVSGVDHTNEIIENPDYNLIIVAYDINSTNLDGLRKLNELAQSAAEDYRIRTVLLTASSMQAVEDATSDFELFSEVFFVDAIPLKSMVRSNPGLMLLKNGTVIKKWNFHIIPSAQKLADKYLIQN